MTLPTPSARRALHTRQTTFNGYLREDGLWEIEAELRDTKPYAFDSHGRGHMEPGEPVHHMALRITVDDTMTIKDIVTSMSSFPQDACILAADPMRSMIGVTMGPGWRKAIESRLGGVKGCTHLRELLFNCATAAYQSIPAFMEQRRRESGDPLPERAMVPFHLGKCMTWAFDSEGTKRYYPQFANYQPPPRKPK